MIRLFKILPLLLFPLLLTGCPEPATRKVTETMKVNEWVYKQMQEAYLWSHTLVDMDGSGLESKTENYFEGLLYRRGYTTGDRFSSIKYTGDNADETRAGSDVGEMGFGFRFVFVGGDMLVLYVTANSPADKKGLVRGDRITKIDGITPGMSNYKELLSQQSIELEVERGGNTIRLDQTMIYDNPVHYYEIFTDAGLEGTAYLVYNHFTDGDALHNYQQTLRDVFKTFRDRGVTKLILDLRYNGGGEVRNAQRLATLIAKTEWIAKTGADNPVFFFTESNKSFGRPDDFTPGTFIADSKEKTSNANIQELYVITTQLTASASELIIHCFRSESFYGNSLKIVGEATYQGEKKVLIGTTGKNVGSYAISSKSYDWELNPMTLRVYNDKKVSGYEAGIFSPDSDNHIYNSDWLSPVPFGDKDNDPMLNFVLKKYFDYTGSAPETPAAGRGTRSMVAHGPIVTNIPQRGLLFEAQPE